MALGMGHVLTTSNKLKSHAAADDEFGTNDIRTGGGAQVENGLGDLVGFRETLDQDLVLDPILNRGRLKRS
jgi:hypothetical protein